MSQKLSSEDRLSILFNALLTFYSSEVLMFGYFMCSVQTVFAYGVEIADQMYICFAECVVCFISFWKPSPKTSALYFQLFEQTLDLNTLA